MMLVDRVDFCGVRGVPTDVQKHDESLDYHTAACMVGQGFIVLPNTRRKQKVERRFLP